MDDVVARIRQSVDFCIPNEVFNATSEAAAGAGGLVQLPLFVLRKAPQELTDFDLVDADGTSLSLPTRETNAELSRSALLARAERVRPSSIRSPWVHERVEEIALEPPGRALDACDRLIGRALPDSTAPPPHWEADFLARDVAFRFLARLLASASIVAMPVVIKPGQQLLKLSYSEPIMQWNEEWELTMRVGLEPLPAQVDLPFLGAQTFHLEVHPPAGMSVSSGLLAVATRQGPELLEVPSTGRSVHLYMSDGHKAQSGAALVGLRAQRAGFMETARAACAAVTGILALCLLFAGPLAEANKTMPTLLLFFPGLLATFALQPMTHALTQRVLTAIRNLTLVSAAAAFLAAFVLIVAPVQSDLVSDHSAPVRTFSLHGRSQHPSNGRLPHADPSLLSIVADARLLISDQVSPSEHASVTWLRIGWGILLALSLVATILVAIATRKAMA